MSTLFWILLAAGSAFLMMAASRFAIRNTMAVAEKLHISPFIIGITLVAVGTDAPEIINSVMSSYLGKGDINVGDSVGSVFTQSSLVLGLFPFVTGIPILISRRDILLTTALTILALICGVYLMSDAQISRLDALVLFFLWIITSAIAWRYQSASAEPVSELHTATRGTMAHLLLALSAFLIVGLAASGLIRSIVELASHLGIPEYILSFFGASLGTSMPELAVEFTALRRNQRQMALGDVFGSCLVDATLSISSGPLLFPTSVSTVLMQKGSFLAIAALFSAGVLLSIRQKHDRISGAMLIVLYLLAYIYLK